MLYYNRASLTLCPLTITYAMRLTLRSLNYKVQAFFHFYAIEKSVSHFKILRKQENFTLFVSTREEQCLKPNQELLKAKYELLKATMGVHKF